MRRRGGYFLLLAILGAAALSSCGWSSEDRNVTTRSDEAYAAYKEGRANLARFRLEDARDALVRATELDPDFAMAYAELAVATRRLNDREASDRAIETAFEKRALVSEIEQLWIERLHAAFQGDKEGVRAAYEQLVAKYPDEVWTLRLRAEEAKRVNDWQEALACYDKILDADPEAVEIHNLKGYLYLSTGQYAKAVESLQRYAFYAPDQANPHDSLGDAYLSTGRFEEAIEEFVTALEIDPTFVWSAANLAEALALTGQIQKAHSVLDQVKPIYEERHWLAWWNMEKGEVDLRGERWQDLLARVDATPADEKKPGPGSEYGLWRKYVRTIAYLELGDLESAQRAVADLEKDAAAFHEENKAEPRIRDVMKLNYAYIGSRFARAMGKPEEGIEALSEAIGASELSPHELSLFRYELAMAHLEAGHPAQATQAAEDHLSIIPTSPSLNLVAAQAYDAAGEREKALQHLQIYMDVMRNADADHPQVQRATRLLRRLVPRS